MVNLNHHNTPSLIIKRLKLNKHIQQSHQHPLTHHSTSMMPRDQKNSSIPKMLQLSLITKVSLLKHVRSQNFSTVLLCSINTINWPHLLPIQSGFHSGFSTTKTDHGIRFISGCCKIKNKSVNNIIDFCKPFDSIHCDVIFQNLLKYIFHKGIPTLCHYSLTLMSE